MKFKDLHEMNNYINKDKDEYDKVDNPTIGELITEFKETGLQEHVYAFNDDAYFLDDFSDELKAKRINEVIDEDDDEIYELIEICEGIASCNDRELTDDLLDEIEDDKMYRGVDDDL